MIFLHISGFEEFSTIEQTYISYAYASKPEPVVLLEKTTKG